MARAKLGEILIQRGVIDAALLKRALGEQTRFVSQKFKLGQLLIDMRACTWEHIALALSEQQGVPYADLAASITGHLGPHAPAELDGLIYIAVQDRGQVPTVIERRLPARLGTPPDATRRERQIAATEAVLQALLSALA